MSAPLLATSGGLLDRTRREGAGGVKSASLKALEATGSLATHGAAWRAVSVSGGGSRGVIA